MFPGAPISSKESWRLIYEFSISNHLTDVATQQLLDLIRSHCPTPNACLLTVYKLKKKKIGSIHCMYFQYCSICMNEIEMNEKMCSKCSNRSSQLCYYAILPFEDHLKDIFVDELHIPLQAILFNHFVPFRELG